MKQFYENVEWHGSSIWGSNEILCKTTGSDHYQLSGNSKLVNKWLGTIPARNFHSSTLKAVRSSEKFYSYTRRNWESLLLWLEVCILLICSKQYWFFWALFQIGPKEAISSFMFFTLLVCNSNFSKKEDNLMNPPCKSSVESFSEWLSLAMYQSEDYWKDISKKIIK